MLPDFIIHHIMSYLLRDTESLIRISILSKQWFALTASFPLLYFNLGAWSNFFLQEMDTFYRYLEYAVSRFCDQNISAHTLDIYAEYLYLEQIDLFGRCLESLIKKWIRFINILNVMQVHLLESKPTINENISFNVILTTHKKSW